MCLPAGRKAHGWALDNACLSHCVPSVHPDRASWKRELKRAPARVQWDPERDLHLKPLPYRSLQLSLEARQLIQNHDSHEIIRETPASYSYRQQQDSTTAAADTNGRSWWYG
ncbi:DUF4291 family protein [Streptomyces paludis]|uniref:DUF4291 family protein n=1 Tax=Streptomyces paludis TaxID=2282738 RepID=A0A345HMI4_9ACTN|nr:DUF4291 family protein [Streptomyces paludis]